MNQKNVSNFTFKVTQPDVLNIVFESPLNADTVPSLWDQCADVVSNNFSKNLVLDLKNVKYCDSAGLALLNHLKKLQTDKQNFCKVINLEEKFNNLFQYMTYQEDGIKQNFSNMHFPEHVGHLVASYVNLFKDNICFLGELIIQFVLIILKKTKIRWHTLLRIIYETGPQALPIIVLVGFLIGLISTFQASPSFKQFGAQIYMVDLVGLGLVREIGPLLTAVLLAGRTASSFAAEIGTMKINQELDALKTMGINSINFLVLPRILATAIVTPILEIFFILFGILGCMLVMKTLGYTEEAVISELKKVITAKAYLGGLVKVFVFGIVIAGVGCLHGIKTNFGPKAVGNSTTTAVVNSLIMLIIVDGIFALVYYVLGI